MTLIAGIIAAVTPLDRHALVLGLCVVLAATLLAGAAELYTYMRQRSS